MGHVLSVLFSLPDHEPNNPDHDHAHDHDLILRADLAQENTAMMVNHGLPILCPPRHRRHVYRDYDDYYDDYDGHAFCDYDGYYGEYDRFLRVPRSFSAAASAATARRTSWRICGRPPPQIRLRGECMTISCFVGPCSRMPQC